MNVNSKLISLAVTDFALPTPRTGSIDIFSGHGCSPSDGQIVHSQVQNVRRASNSAYEAEVRINGTFDRKGYRFRIDGRMDGVFANEYPKIEEIKVSFNIRELANKLVGDPMSHPYCLQLLTYGYFYWLDRKVVPELTFYLVSPRNENSLNIKQEFDIPAYERWLELRLDELILDIKRADKRSGRRKKVAQFLTFPFASARPGQSEIVQTIEQGMQEGQAVLIQAPTGLGKTVGVLYPVLREALRRGQKVVYVTPKNSQHSVAEETIMRFQKNGATVKSLTITAKNKICFRSDPFCSPDFCEYAKNYYTKVQENHLLDRLARKKNLKASVFRHLGEDHKVCPYELQFDCADEADVIICDYNYIFAPRSVTGRIGRIVLGHTGKPNLVIDEAHNLVTRAMEYHSVTLSTELIKQMFTQIQHSFSSLQSDIQTLLDECIRAIASCQPCKKSTPTKLDPPIHTFVEQESKIRTFLSECLDGNSIDIRFRDTVLKLFFYWSRFTDALLNSRDSERQEFLTTFHPDLGGGSIKHTCCDASGMLKDCYKDYKQVIGFSATLKPFAYYANLCGFNPENVKTAEFQSPFPKENRKLLIIPQISTKYQDRERNYPRIADAISKIVSIRQGNYLAFFPSFDFMERVLASFAAPTGFTVMSQERGMQASRVETILEHLRNARISTIVFAVQGGSLSEGVDYPGDMVVGAFIIGPSLPSVDIEHEYMREYYHRIYGEGFGYAYTIPAMAKSIQAAGRVIRSETDRGLIVLMDNRFCQSRYSRCMPLDWFNSHVQELVSGSIIREVSDFWKT